MATDEQLFQQHRWFLQLQRGEELTLIPSDDEPFVVTDVFLLDPQSAAGQGIMAAYVEMGTQKIMLAELSSEVSDVVLETPLVLDEEFRLYVTRSGGDSDADNDTDEDAVVVQFEGFMLSQPYSDSEEESEEEEEGDEEAASSEDDETEEELEHP